MSYNPNLFTIIVFMISFDPAKIDLTRKSVNALAIEFSGI